MSWTDKSLRNPAAVAVVVAIATILGFVTIFRLPVQLLPDIDKPKLGVQTIWPGASAREVESEIAEPLEEVLQGIPGMERLITWNNASASWVDMTFAVGTDMNKAMLEVISRLNRLPPLPADVEPPQLMPRGFDNTASTLIEYYIQLKPGTPGGIMDHRQYIRDSVVPRLRAIPGVADVALEDGALTGDQLQIIFDPYKAAELGINLADVAFRAGSGNDVSGGFVDVGRRQYTIRFEGRFSPERLGNLILDWRDGKPVRLSDVARIEVGPGPKSGFIYQNGAPAISLGIENVSGANVLAALTEVRSLVADLNAGEFASRGLEARSLFDPSVYILRAANLLLGNLVVGTLLAVGALWWFLRRFRATIIIAAAIPISLLSTFVFLGLAGRSLNVISLAGLAFATGMVLDAAIVVLENIVRLREKGVEIAQASRQGALQVRGALLASTATTVAIFVPIVFMDGEEGQVFADLALTIAVSIAVSFIVAVTVLPTAAKVWLRDRKASEKRATLWHNFADRIMRVTNTDIKRMAWIAGLLAIPIAVAVLFFPTLNYMPPVKRDSTDAWIFLPPGTGVDDADENIAQVIMARLKPHLDHEERPYIAEHAFATWPGMTGAGLFILPEEGEDFQAVETFIQTDILAGIPDIFSFVQRPSLFGRFEDSSSVQLIVQSNDLGALRNVLGPAYGIFAQTLVDDEGRPAIVNAPPSVDAPTLEFNPNDRRLAEVGWGRQEAGMIVRALGDGLWLGEHFDGENRLDIILRAEDWNDPETFMSIPLVTPRGGTVPVGELIDLNRTISTQFIMRVDGRRSQMFWINPPPETSLQELIGWIETRAEPELRKILPPDANIIYGGSADSLNRAVTTMGSNFLMALLLLFMIMAALFRSVRDSAIVLISIPLSTFGGVLAIRLLDLVSFQPADLLTMIGFIILLGLVVNNAILLVAQTRASEAEGLSRPDAVRQALELRLRPIFMTTLTSIFGMLPLLLVPGEGSQIYRGMAAAIVGGMAVSTIFTLIFMPSLMQLSLASFGLGRKQATVGLAERPPYPAE